MFLFCFYCPLLNPTPTILLWLWVSMALMTRHWVTSPLIPVSLCVCLASTQVLFFVLFFATGLLKVCSFKWCWQASLDFEFNLCAGCLNHLQRMFTFSSILAVFGLLTLYSSCTMDYNMRQPFVQWNTYSEEEKSRKAVTVKYLLVHVIAEPTVHLHF